MALLYKRAEARASGPGSTLEGGLMLFVDSQKRKLTFLKMFKIKLANFAF